MLDSDLIPYRKISGKKKKNPQHKKIFSWFTLAVSLAQYKLLKVLKETIIECTCHLLAWNPKVLEDTLKKNNKNKIDLIY